MSTDPHPSEADPALSSLRKTARFRSWFCPGAGFAYLGRAGLAVLTFSATVALLPAAAWLTFQPEAIPAWTFLGIIFLAVGLGVAEQFVVGRAASGPQGPAFLVAGFVVTAVGVWVAMLGVVVLLLTGFGSLQMAGSGMSPTLQKGERLVYARRAPTEQLGRGSLVLFRLSEKSAWGQPGWLTVGRILAVPGDRLAIRDQSYLVNGAPGPEIGATRPYDPVLVVPEEPESITVPPECYFIVQDDPRNSYDSRVLSWMEGKRIASDRLFQWRGGGLLTRVE